MPYSVPITSQSIYAVSLLCPKTPARPKASPPPERCLRGMGAHIPAAPTPHPTALSTRSCCLWSPGQGTRGLVMPARKCRTPKHREHGHQGGLHCDPFGDTNSPASSRISFFLMGYQGHTLSPRATSSRAKRHRALLAPLGGTRAWDTWPGVPMGAQMSSWLNRLFIWEH